MSVTSEGRCPPLCRHTEQELSVDVVKVVK
jgi:hypothetical protein